MAEKRPKVFKSAFYTYTVIRQIGCGGSGTVLAVRDMEGRQLEVRQKPRRSSEFNAPSKVDSNYGRVTSRELTHIGRSALHHDGEPTGPGFPGPRLSTTERHSVCFALLWR